MRRRLTIVILVVVAGALAVAGLGSLLLVRRADANQTRAELVQQAEAIAAQADEAQRPTVLTLVQRAARLYSSGILALEPNGTLANPNARLPAGFTLADLHPELLLQDDVVSSVVGSLAYAVVPIHLSATDLARARSSTAAAARTLFQEEADGMTLVEVATRQVPGPAGGVYFAIAAAATLLVAAAVADRLGRRIARPLAEVESAARRIAAGDLEGRAEISRGDYPELASLAQSINTMTESLARAKGLERQFLMSVSHDLRTPLTSIKGWAEAVGDGAADPKRAAAVIGAEADRLQRLVQDLLDLARIDARSFSTHPVTTDLVAVVAARVEGFRPAAEEAGLRLEVDRPDGPVTVEVDPDRLGQVVANLVENAYKFARHRIRVGLSATPGQVEVAVEDDGPGIRAADLDHVFERLYQVALTPARQAGSGLGLTIVKELAEAMGGRVRMDSPVGPEGGTRIVVSLPLRATWPSSSPSSTTTAPSAS